LKAGIHLPAHGSHIGFRKGAYVPDSGHFPDNHFVSLEHEQVNGAVRICMQKVLQERCGLYEISQPFQLNHQFPFALHGVYLTNERKKFKARMTINVMNRSKVG